MTYLFTDGELSIEELQEQCEANQKGLRKLRKWRKEQGDPFRKGEAVFEDTISFVESRIGLKRAMDNGKISLRRLITMGSPLAMIILRSDDNVRSLAYDIESQL